MASTHLQKLIALLLNAILNNVVPAIRNALLTAEKQHMALCLQKIVYHYFIHGRSTVVFMPLDLRNNSRRPQFSYHTAMT